MIKKLCLRKYLIINFYVSWGQKFCYFWNFSVSWGKKIGKNQVWEPALSYIYHGVSWRISDVTHLELFVQQMNDECPFLSQSVVLYDVSDVRLSDWEQGHWLRWYSPLFELFLAFCYPTLALLNQFVSNI